MKRTAITCIALMLVVGLLAVTGVMAGDESVTGTVEQTDQGIVIAADSGDTYLVKGKDLSSMVGKTVKATGMLAEGESGKTLTIVSVEPVQE